MVVCADFNSGTDHEIPEICFRGGNYILRLLYLIVPENPKMRIDFTRGGEHMTLAKVCRDAMFVCHIRNHRTRDLVRRKKKENGTCVLGAISCRHSHNDLSVGSLGHYPDLLLDLRRDSSGPITIDTQVKRGVVKDRYPRKRQRWGIPDGTIQVRMAGINS